MTHDPSLSQLAIVSRSADRVARARSYSSRLGAHVAEIRARLDAAAGDETAGPLRGELIEVEGQHRQAVEILAGVEAEHARHAADLRAFHGDDGAARAALRERQAERDGAKAAADGAKAILGRAEAHAATVNGRLAAARAAEARYDADATARLHAALRDGIEVPAAAAPFHRASAGLEDDARAARAAVDRLKAEHAAKLDALDKAERQVRVAVDAVMLADADAMAREATALEARLGRLRRHLTVYTMRRPGDYVASDPGAAPLKQHPGGWFYHDTPVALTAPQVRTTPAIAAAVARPLGAPAIATGPADHEAWNTYAAALALDHGAEMTFETSEPGRPDPSAVPASLGHRAPTSGGGAVVALPVRAA